MKSEPVNDAPERGAKEFANLVKALLDDARAKDNMRLADMAQAMTRTAEGTQQLKATVEKGFGEQAESLGQLLRNMAQLDSRVRQVERSMTQLGSRMERLEAEMRLVSIEEKSTRQQVMLVRKDQEELNGRVDTLESRLSKVEAKMEI